MIEDDFEFIIHKPLHQEKLVCEIYYKGKIFGEVSETPDGLVVDIYPSKSEKKWKVSLQKLQRALETGKNHLLGQLYGTPNSNTSFNQFNLRKKNDR